MEEASEEAALAVLVAPSRPALSMVGAALGIADGDQRRECHGGDDGDRELTMRSRRWNRRKKTIGTNTVDGTRPMPTRAPVIWPHRALEWLPWGGRPFRAHDPLDVLDHHDGIRQLAGLMAEVTR